MFLVSEITAVHRSLIITAYMTISRVLSCDGLFQKAFRRQTKGPASNHQPETNTGRHVPCCYCGHDRPQASSFNALGRANKDTCGRKPIEGVHK